MLKKYSKYIPLVFIIIIGLLPLYDLFHSGLPLTHDGKDHLARIANFYGALEDGILIPRWGANLNWGFGHPVIMFLYPLPSYIASIFHLIGFSFIDSLKIVFGLSFVFSGIGMYVWVNRFLGTSAAFVGAILYMFAPYRFVNLYVRGAVGEHVSFTFIPFILFLITRIFLEKNKSKKFIVLNTIGIAVLTGLLILSHNALSMLFLGFGIFYTLLLYFYNKNLIKLLSVFFGIIYGFLLSAFFWVPAYLEGKYTLRDIVTGGSEYADRFVLDPLKFFVPSWSHGITGELSVQIGIIHIVLIALGIFAIFRMSKKEKLKKTIFYLGFILLIFSLFMMLKESNFVWRTITIIQKFQFPWRFLSLVVLASALLGSYAVYIFNKKSKVMLMLGVFLISIILFYSSYWRANGYLLKDDAFFEKVYYGTTDTGESAPIWSVRFMEKEAKAPIEILSGKAFIQETFRSSIRHEYIVEAEEKTRIKENTLYFPGWNVYVDGKKLDVNTQIEFQDEKNRGIMTFWIEPGKHEVSIVFEDTKLRQASNLLSIIVSIVLIVIFARVLLVKKNK